MAEICGYTDRYAIQGEKGWWRRWCWEPAGHKGSHFRPPEPVRTFVEIMAERKRERDERERLAALPAEPEIVVIQEAREVAVKELPAGPKKVAAWVTQNEAWRLRITHTRTRHRAEHYAADSKSTGAKKGDLKRAAYEQDNWFVAGAMRVEYEGRVLRAHFRATWAQVKGCTFESALVGDNLEQFVGRVDAVPVEYVVSQSGDFEDWLRALAPVGAPKKREKKTKQSEATAEDLITTGEWIG